MILDAALPLFSERGYGATSMDSIAKAAGVTKPVLYDCYPNKAELFRALIDREEKHLLEQVMSVVPADPDLSDPERLLAELLTASFEGVASKPHSWRAVFGAQHGLHPEIDRRVRRARATQVKRIEQIVTRLLEGRGVIDAKRKAALLAHTINASADAVAQLVLEDPGRWQPKEVGPMLAALIMRGEQGL